MTYKNKKYLLAAIILALGPALPSYNASAFSIFGVDDIGYLVINKFFAYSLSVMFTAVGKLLGMMVVMLSWVVNLRVYSNTPIIEEGWKIMRNFANMLFIIALIVMAYGTIFNIKGYDFKSLIPKFLIAALLINFSLVIGTLVIDGTQILNNTFLLAMGDISGRLGDGLNPAQILPEGVGDIGDTEAIANAVTASILTLIFSIFLLFTFLISVAVPLVIAFVRIPILWALLIVSPMAWLLNILPATRGVYKKWWHHFLAWNLFLPYYLFFMYFALYFLSKKDEVLQGLGQDFVYSQLNGLQSNFTFGLLFYYVMVAIFMIGGTKVAMSAGTFSGTGIVSVAKWGRGMAMRRLGVTATQRAAMQRLEQAKKEGLPGKWGILYGGERALELETARRARLFGVRGSLEKGVDIEKEKQKPFANNINELRRLADSGSTEQKLAARTRLTELNALDRTRINQTYQWLGGDRSEAANKYIGGVDFSKLSAEDRKSFSGTLTNLEARKKNAMAMAEKDKLGQTEIESLARQFTNEEEIKEFLNKGQKKNLLAIASARMALGLSEAATIDDEIASAIKKMSDDQILEMDESNFKDPAIQAGLDQVLKDNPGRLENLAKRASGDKHVALDAMAKTARAAQIQRQSKPLNDKKLRIEGQLNIANVEMVNLTQQLDQLKNYPNSDDYKRVQREVASKESEIKSLQGKLEKIDERIEDITLKQTP